MRSLSRMKDWTLTERGHSAAILDDQLSWRDRALYVWLSEIGLTPAKSLSLGPLAVPDQYFADFFRGCIELIAPCSCTSIVITFRSQSVASTSVCTCLLCRRATDSFEWLRTTVERLTHANGSIEMRERQGGHALWRLRYAKAESIQRLRWMYYASNVPCLERRKQRPRSSCLRSVMRRCATQVGQGRVVIQCRLGASSIVERITPEWSNGSLAALKKPCP